MTQDVPAIPLVTAVVRTDATGELTVDGTTEAIRASSSAAVSEEILRRVTALAGDLGRPVRLTTDDDQGRWPLIVHPDGNVDSGGDPLLRTDARISPAAPEAAAAPSEPIPAAFEPTPAPAEPTPAIFEPTHPGTEPTHPGAESAPTTAEPTPTARIELPIDLRPQSAATSASAFGETPLGIEEDGIEEDGIDDPVAVDFEQTITPDAGGTLPAPAAAAAAHLVGEGEPAAEPESVEAPPSRRRARESFLDEETRPKPASRGVRGLIARTGIRVPPSAKEAAERADVHAVSQHWPGPRTIAIVNGKGGANKTPTTAMLSAVFARNGGSGVLAWDNNETRGTLGWRTEEGPHTATVQSLLPNAEALLSPGARAADLSQFVHHQTGDKYDVLRSNPTMLATEQRIASEDFDRLHAVVTKYFRLIFIDSGNDESAERWLRMIDHTDQLVIATTALGEHAEAGALLLEALAQRDEHSAALAASAVVIVSQSEKSAGRNAAQRVADSFGTMARVAVPIPFDRAMHAGKLRYDDLDPATRRAWLRAGAAVAEGL